MVAVVDSAYICLCVRVSIYAYVTPGQLLLSKLPAKSKIVLWE